jgi:hypothetical protein
VNPRKEPSCLNGGRGRAQLDFGSPDCSRIVARPLGELLDRHLLDSGHLLARDPRQIDANAPAVGIADETIAPFV